MENYDELKDIDIKYRTCYYFDDIIKIEDFNFDNILIDEKSYENIFVYDISYKTLIGAKPMCISFDKVNGFSRFYDVTRDLLLFGPEKFEAKKVVISQKSGFTYVISHNYAKIKIDLKILCL